VLAIASRRSSPAIMFQNLASHPLVQLERGRAAVIVGDRQQAIEAYGYVADAWLHADSVLQPYVAEAHTALRTLGAEDLAGRRIVLVP
jgi:hypothetical protein